jgi:hypothetical protein
MKGMNQKLNPFYITLVIFPFLLSLATVVMAEARTDVTIKNYKSQDIIIQIKQVKLNGEIEWKEIGRVSARRARTFHNVSIGSVLQANLAVGGAKIKEFRVQPDKTEFKIE